MELKKPKELSSRVMLSNTLSNDSSVNGTHDEEVIRRKKGDRNFRTYVFLMLQNMCHDFM